MIAVKLFLRVIITALVVFLPIDSTAESCASFKPGYYFIKLTDKNNSPYCLSNPGEFLSNYSIVRREKFGIELNEMDLPVNPQYVASIADIADVIYTSKWFNAVLAVLNSESELADIQSLAFYDDFIYLKPLEISEDSEIKKPQNYHYSDIFNPLRSGGVVTNVDNFYESAYGYMEEQILMLNGHVLHNNGYFGAGVPVALFDAGYYKLDSLFAFSHLWDNNRIIDYISLVDDDENIFDSHHHGTMVLSTMAAIIPGQLMGAAPEASYLLIRSEDVHSEYLIEEANWLRAAEIADSAGVYIINSSLGYTEFDCPSQNYTYDDLDGESTISARAANYAHQRGMLVISSAGNYAQRDWTYIGTPADSYEAIAAGAVLLNGERAIFSSLGPSADGRVKPDIMAPGQNVVIVNGQGIPTQGSGTSFSAPLVSALTACLWQEFPNKNNQEIKNAIIKSSSRYLNPDSNYGFGIPDFAKARNILKGIDVPELYKLSIVPNPVRKNSYLDFYSDKQKHVNISIYNIKGQIVDEINNVFINKGANKIFPFNDIFSIMNSGVYIIKISSGSDKYIGKALKAF